MMENVVRKGGMLGFRVKGLGFRGRSCILRKRLASHIPQTTSDS